MLDRTDFASWQQHGTVRETLAEGIEGAPHLGLERRRVYSDLSPEEKDRYNANIKATNILLQGLPKDIYTLINHYTDAKDIWDNVKMLLEGETIHAYYVWCAKLINDMRNIKMTMSRMQLNSKFVNNMLLEWGTFVIAVKLSRVLKDSNYDQLYAYLKQHEAHANENKMMLDQFTQHTVDPLALMSNGNNSWGGGAAGYGEAQNRVRNANTGRQDNAIDEDVDEQPIQDLALNVDNVFQADDCDAFDSDVDEAP
nr:hypothetical protein [Tanacetum cinerariifolium]